MTTEPIRNLAKIKQMYEHLAKGSDRNALLFKLGINSILRVSDMLCLRYCDIFEPNGTPHKYLTLTEMKTKNSKKIRLNKGTLEALTDFCDKYELENDDWIFFSLRNPAKHIDYTVSWKFLTKAAKYCNIHHFGNHSMRKTYASYIYSKTKDLALLRKMLGHKSSQVTLRYIGVEQTEIDKAYQEFEL